MTLSKSLILLMAGLFTLPVSAATHEGVTMDDTISVGGETLLLNGMGLREKFFIDIYVGGLYLPSKTTDAKKAIESDVAKQIVMRMTYDLSKEKLGATMRDSISKAKSPEVASKADTLAGWMEDVTSGDEIRLEYVPGKGTSVIVKGKNKGTLAGTEMMKALWDIYLGANPPTNALKKGMLGQ